MGRRPALFTLQAGAAVMVVVFSQLSDPSALLIGGAVMGMFVNGMLGGYGALLAELYPTEARATAENVLFIYKHIMSSKVKLLRVFHKSRFVTPRYSANLQKCADQRVMGR